MEDNDYPIKTVADLLMDAFNGISSATAQRASKLKDIRLVIEVGKANQLPEVNLNDYFRNATLTEEIQIMITVINSGDPFGTKNSTGAASDRFIRQL
jgi:DNA gyrase/topoisomerase IV subunit A